MAKAERKSQHDIFLHSINDLQLEAIGGVEFTHREVDIIACILSGKTAKKIAAFLSISPKTVENHIRNIMLKLGCRTQENIIDFIERSNKFTAIKRHYSNLLLQSFFESELKKIAAYNAEIKNCVIFYSADCKEFAANVARFANHLKLCGIQSVIKGNKYNDPDVKDIDYILYINTCNDLLINPTCIQEERFALESIARTSKQYAIPAISVFLNKGASLVNRQELLVNDQMILIEQTNYYLLVFATLKAVLNKNIEDNIVEFTRQLDELTDNVSPLPNNNIIPEQKTTTAQEPRKVNGVLLGILLVGLGFGILYLVINLAKDAYILRDRARTADSFFNWMRDKELADNDLATKYLDSLEEEEEKLGRLENSIDTIRFLRNRRNFATISNLLINLPEEDSHKALKLIAMLHEKFPLHNRTNEKIHKMFFALASYYGKLVFIEHLMEDAQISFGDFKDYYGNTAPMLAAAGNRFNTFKWLAKKDALFINHTNVEGNSVLILAALNLPSDEKLDEEARSSSIAIMKKIIEYDGSSLRIRGHKNCSPLLVAGAKGNITAIEYLLELLAPNDPVKQLQILQEDRNADGNNIMMLAAYNGRGHVIEWLHSKGISITQRNKYNTTAFMQAASGGSTKAMDIIYRLHNESARRNSINLLLEKNDFGQTALFLAVHDNHMNAFQWIMARLHKNNFNSSNELVSEYIHSARNADGDSLLHVLINGMSDTKRFSESALNTGLLDVLLDYLDVNTYATLNSNKKGDTPLMRAAYYGDLTIVKYLIEKCAADPTLKNHRDEDAIEYAVMGGHGQYFKVIEYLWELRAKQEGKTFSEIKYLNSNDLFLTAAQHGQRAVVEWLLRDNPELIESRTANGANALTLAIKNAHIDVIEFIFTWDRKTAVRLALEKRPNATANILEQLGLGEKSGKTKRISLSRYLEQKVGVPIETNTNRSNRHNDSSYKWRALEIGIEGLSTGSIQPWSPYYLHYDSRLKEHNDDELF